MQHFRYIPIALTLFYWTLSISTTVGQLPVSKEKLAWKKIQTGQWNKAKILLNKSLKKDSTSITTHYLYGTYFSDKRNPRFNIDSASLSTNRATGYYNLADSREREKLRRFPLDGLILNNLRLQIDTLAFHRAIQESSLEAFQYYLSHFKQTVFEQRAIYLRDSAAFQLAAQSMRAKDFKNFLDNYPESSFKPEALQKWHKLVYQEETSIGTIEAFENFADHFPNNPWRNEAIEKIFYRSTASGEPKYFERFANKYPEHLLANRSKAILQYLNPDHGRGRWLPYAENNLFGYINLEGQLKIKPTLKSLYPEFICPDTETELVVTPLGVFDKNGKQILSEPSESAKHIGAGFYWLTMENKGRLIHGSGWEPFTDNIQNASTIENRFLSIKSNNQWNLYALNGQILSATHYDSIYTLGSKLVLNRKGRLFIFKSSDLLSYLEGKASFRTADEVVDLGNGQLMIRISALEEMVNVNFETIIQPDRHQIRNSPGGILLRKNNLIQLPDWKALNNQSYKRVEFAEPWMKTVSANGESLHFMPSKSTIELNADSIWFQNRFSFALRGDSITLYTPERRNITFSKDDEFKFLTARDSSLYFLVARKNKLTLHDAASGKKLFSGIYTEIQPITSDYFIVRLRGKLGLTSRTGKELLKADYDAMIYQNGWFSLLRENKFGGYQPTQQRILKPIYDANLIVYSDEILAVRKIQKWGFLIKNQKPESVQYKFDEIRQVNDSLAMVRTNTNWQMISVYDNKIITDGILEWQVADSDERILFRKSSGYGLLSKNLGVIIEPIYSELLWWSDDRHTLFMGIKKVNDTVSQLDYLNSHGLILRSTKVRTAILDDLICED